MAPCVALVVVLAAGCTGAGSVELSKPTDFCDDDSRALPGLSRPTDFNRGRGRVGVLEGLTVEDSEAEAAVLGFVTIESWRCDLRDGPGERPLVFSNETIGLYHDDGIVRRAWVGG